MQAPFVTIFMYLNEVEDGQLKDDLAMIIEEVVKQRYEGVKNKNGVWITPAFPKLVYVLEEDNIKEDGKYYYLTKLCAKCTAKRLVPDYVSEKIMFENKVDKNGNGHCYPPMGCVDGSEVVTYTIHGNTYVESLERMWDRLSNYYEIKTQPNGTDKYMDTKGVEIYDSKVGFVKNHRIIRNHSTSWMRVTFKNGRSILCTEDHPFETENRGVVLAKDLSPDDTISIDRASDFIDKTRLIPMKDSKAWMYGFLLCDSTYTEHITASIDAHTENDIEKFFCDVARDDFGLNTNIILQQRGEKGTYKDLRLVPSDNLIPKLSVELISLFGGKAKKTRHIPNEVFTWCDSARTSFLAGMIDADGYINSTGATTVVQIGSTNKELAIQQMLLAQTLGMGARIYTNHYSKKNKDNIRYRVEFVPNSNLLSKIICKKKTGRDINLEPIHASPCCNEMTSIIKLEKVEMSAYSYDVTTDSEHFTVSGLYSHNCRSFLTPYIDENGKPKYYGRLTHL